MNNAGEIILSGAFTGAMPIRDDITILPADDPKRLRPGWVVYEQPGIALVNQYAIDRIAISNDSHKDIIGKLGEYMRKYAR